MTQKERQAIRQMAKDNVPIRQVKDTFMHLHPATVSNVYHGHDIERRKRRMRKLEYNIKPFNSDTCVVEGWRVPFDENRKSGEVTTRQMTPEEWEKYGQANVKKSKGSFVITRGDIMRSLKRRGLQGVK